MAIDGTMSHVHDGLHWHCEDSHWFVKMYLVEGLLEGSLRKRSPKDNNMIGSMSEGSVHELVIIQVLVAKGFFGKIHEQCSTAYGFRIGEPLRWTMG